MSAFDDLIDEYLGSDDALTDIRIVVRRLWFYDFVDYPLRVWDGKGKLFTTDGNEWLGTIDSNNRNIHITPSIQDGRDGASLSYKFGLTIPDIPGQAAGVTYEALKADQHRVAKRMLISYLAIFEVNEALRPQTPIVFFKELTMFSPTFEEALTSNSAGQIIRNYKVSITAKDGNYGRSNVPNGTYADTVQKKRAAELGVSLDRGSEWLAQLANRTYQIP